MATSNKYPAPLRVLHWLSAALILGLLVIGFYMADLPSDAANKYDLYPMHKAFGMIALFMLLVRLPLRLKGPVPKAPEGLLAWELKLSHVVHIGLYVAMFSMMLSGYLMNSTFEYVNGVDIFGLFTVPDITPKSAYWNGVAHTVHTVSAWSLVGLLVLHLGGVIKHKYLDQAGSDVLERMV